MIKKIFIGILLLSVIGVLIIAANFSIFEPPFEMEIKTECDNEGLRKIRMVEMSGNATVNRSIHIYAIDCNYEESSIAEQIFIASASFIKPKDVGFEWKNFDTLIIRYNKILAIYKQIKVSESVKPKIIFEYIPE